MKEEEEEGMKRRGIEEKEGKKGKGPHMSLVMASSKGPLHGDSQRTSWKIIKATARSKAQRGRDASRGHRKKAL